MQTRSSNPGPIQAVDMALDKLTSELNAFTSSFEKSLKAYVQRTKQPTGDVDDPMRD